MRALRALRGGSWNNPAQNLRSASRNRNPAEDRNDDIGFRVSCGPANTLTDLASSHRAGGIPGVRVDAERAWPARSRRPSWPSVRAGHFSRVVVVRRLGRLFDLVAGLDNLAGAWRDFRRGKRSRPSVRSFAFDADHSLIRLHRELTAESYRPRGYRLLLIHEPKTRVIAAAPVRDRVVHHAVYRVLSPRLDRSLIDTTFACLPGRGSHRAVIALLGALRRHRYVLLLDVRHYFLGIDRAILREVMERRIKDRRLLAMLGVIADSGDRLYDRRAVRSALHLPAGFPAPGCGLPIGNLTSQWWGNHYLSGLDHFVKRELKIPHYQRYMDDMTLLADSRAQLLEAREAVAAWLGRERRLALKDPRATVRSTDSRLLYLGHRVDRDGIDPGPGAVRRARRRLTALARQGEVERFGRSLASYRGLLGFPRR